MYNFVDLDDEVRQLMLEEFDQAAKTNNLYYSKRFNQGGNELWASLLRESIEKHDAHWLAYQLESKTLLTEFETAAKPLGGYTIKHVPHNASETLADGQINRFYLMGLCRKAIKLGKQELTIYRAKDSKKPSPDASALIGTQISVEETLAMLRSRDKSLRMRILRPNSGLSARL